MTAEETALRWARVEALFDAATSLPAGERAAFIDGADADDDLRHELLSLLEVDGTADTALQDLVGAGAGAALSRGLEGRRLGPYRLVRELGKGGMGAVYLAVRDDSEYRTEVAIKVLHRGLETDAAVARFRDERQILATLEHPGIVRMLDGGSTEDGLPYLVMEHVEGVPITTWAAQENASVRQRAALFQKVCDAVAYAHGRLIVHRDLKPQNILVNARGEPKLLDFGIARLLDDSGREAHTRTGAQLLTPGYASPEQVRGEPVSTSADVYALGAVLYELMSGARPHEVGTGLEALRAVLEVEAPKPSTRAPSERRRALEGDLDNVILMALQKDPRRRYGSVEQLSADLARHLDGRPVAARAASFGYRAGKLVRRHKGALAAAVLVATALSTATVVALGQAAEAAREARRAEKHFTDVRRLANSLLFEVDENIRDAPGTTAARELIVRRALEYLDGLAAEAADDDGLARELALAYMKIGDIQGNAFAANLGRPDDGLASYARARAILARAVAADPTASTARGAMARLEYGTAALHASKSDFAPAVAAVEAAERIVATSLTDDLGLDEATRARGNVVLVQAARDAGDRAAAMRAVDRLGAFARDFAARSPTADARYWTAVAHEVKALALLTFDADPDAALAAESEASAVVRALSAEVPDNAAYRRELYFTTFVIGGLNAGYERGIWAASTGDLAAAERAYRESLAVAEQIAARDAVDQRALAEVALARTLLAWVIQRRDPASALALLESARAELARLPEASVSASSSEWVTICVSAVVRARLGQREAALADFDAGLAIASRDFPDGLDPLQCRFLGAEALALLGDERAVKAFGALDVELSARLAAEPENVHAAIGLSDTLERRADLLGSCALLSRALKIWRARPETRFVARRRQHLEQRVSACAR